MQVGQSCGQQGPSQSGAPVAGTDRQDVDLTQVRVVAFRPVETGHLVVVVRHQQPGGVEPRLPGQRLEVVDGEPSLLRVVGEGRPVHFHHPLGVGGLEGQDAVSGGCGYRDDAREGAAHPQQLTCRAEPQFRRDGAGCGQGAEGPDGMPGTGRDGLGHQGGAEALAPGPGGDGHQDGVVVVVEDRETVLTGPHLALPGAVQHQAGGVVEGAETVVCLAGRSCHTGVEFRHRDPPNVPRTGNRRCARSR